MLVEPQPDLELVGEADDGLAAISLASTLQPDVVVTDVRMAPLDGIETTLGILRVSPETKVLVLTTHALDEYLYDSLRAGASGFLLKATPAEEIVEGIRSVASGNGLLSPAMTRKLIDTFATTPEPTRPGRRLPANVTEREREVLVAVSQGLTNQEIATALHMSVATTKTHVSRLLAKIGAHERAQLVIAAYETGLVSPGRP
jgi:DNA-binding NarL/FixJ family response regulator